ncbi:unnamed protein product, partial [Prorocentrum cordatum]
AQAPLAAAVVLHDLPQCGGLNRVHLAEYLHIMDSGKRRLPWTRPGVLSPAFLEVGTNARAVLELTGCAAESDEAGLQQLQDAVARLCPASVVYKGPDGEVRFPLRSRIQWCAVQAKARAFLKVLQTWVRGAAGIHARASRPLSAALAYGLGKRPRAPKRGRAEQEADAV